MSRLDDHVASVQNRLALAQFLEALARAGVLLGAVVWLAVLVHRLFLLAPPRPGWWLIAGMAAATLGAIAHAIWCRPGAHEAAVAIDQRLALKEKISTALYVRPATEDPFADAAVRDAEATAQQLTVNLRQHFPLRWPRAGYGAIALVLAAAMSYWLIDPMKLFGREEKRKQEIARQDQVEKARKTVANALATVSAVPPSAADQEAVKLAKAELQALLNQPINDPAKANRTAVKALQDMNEALKQQVKTSARFAEAQNAAKMFRSMQQPIEGQGPIAEAQRSLVRGEFTAAINELTQAVENFDKLDKQQQQQVARQMQQLAQQLQQMANNPQQQQQMQQQLQQMGLNQQQAQQMQQLMQQAAQGDRQAQQQLQQMAQQAIQQMQAQNPQMAQQMQQMMAQMQAQMNNQQQAQQMAQAAQQMAQAMQQAAQAQPNMQGQQMNQQMAQGLMQMQQSLQQMQAAAQDAQQIAAAQAAAQAAQADAQNAMSGNQGAQQANAGAAQWNPNANVQGQNQGQWNGQANFAGPNPGGIGAGDRTYKSAAPYGVKQEISQSQEDEKGRILASNYIKDNKPLKGQAGAALQEVVASAQKEQTDEIDQQRISRQAQKVVREYFGSMQKEAEPGK